MKINAIKPDIKKHMDIHCGPYSTLKKDKLIEYIGRHTKEGSNSNLKKKSMVELKKLAKRCKEMYCKPPLSKMKKKNMINYAHRHLGVNPNGNFFVPNLYNDLEQLTPQTLIVSPHRKRSRSNTNNSRAQRPRVDGRVRSGKRPLVRSDTNNNRAQRPRVDGRVGSGKRPLVRSDTNNNRVQRPRVDRIRRRKESGG